jgi:putative ABC transport system permease protein
MTLLKLAAKSAWNRKISLSLAMFSIAISMLLLLGVDKIRKEAKTSFLNTISQTDLIVGARSGSINLLLYSVFRIGNATNNISYESYQDIAGMKDVKWTVPISLGDSHRGFRVMGTSHNYFTYYRYGNNRALELKSGLIFKDVYDTVIGSDVAQKLNYKVNDKIIVSHGLISGTFSEHDDKPFRIAGILKKTGTPVDRTVHVSLQGIEAIHIDWQSGTRSPLKISAERARKMNLQPKTITAFMLGLENKIDTFRLQRKINEYVEEPLLAILPGATLAMLWQTIGHFEKILLAVSGLALMTGLMSILTVLLAALNERRREMAVLRAVGAHAYHVALLFILEAFLVVAAGALFGIAMLYLLQIVIQPILSDSLGIYITISALDIEQMMILCGAISLGVLFSLIPGLIAYKRSLQDGLMIKV